MDGLFNNYGYSARVGDPAESESRMFSVGGLVAFRESYWCSAGGREGAVEGNYLQDEYFLQEEIELVEFDRSEPSKGGLTKLNYQKIVKLKDVFFRKTSSWSRGYDSSDLYVFAVLPDGEAKISGRTIAGTRIEEIRRNSGRFLHVYLVEEKIFHQESDRLLKAKSFDEAVAVLASSEDPEEVEKRARKQYAREQFDKLIATGLSWPRAQRVFIAAGPGYCLKAVEYAAWLLEEVTEKRGVHEKDAKEYIPNFLSAIVCGNFGRGRKLCLVEAFGLDRDKSNPNGGYSFFGGLSSAATDRILDGAIAFFQNK